MISQEKSSKADTLPYRNLWDFIRDFHDKVDNLVDQDYDFEEAEILFDRCYPIRSNNEDAEKILNHICMGHNAPAETKEKFL